MKKGEEIHWGEIVSERLLKPFPAAVLPLFRFK